jgi:hypothetical protein
MGSRAFFWRYADPRECRFAIFLEDMNLLRRPTDP